MKNKILKKLMIFGLVCSMSLTMVPTTVMAAGMQTESETRQTEETQTEKPQAETKAMIKLPDETEQPTTKNAAESESNAAETPQSETRSSEAASKETSAKETEQPTASGAVEEILDQPGRAPRAAEAGYQFSVEGGEKDKDYTYNENTGVLVIKSEKALTITGTGECVGRIEVEAEKAKVTLSNVELYGESGPALIVRKGKSLDLMLEKVNKLIAGTDNSVAVEMEAGASLVIGGRGKLDIQGKGTERDISMSRGDRKTDPNEKKDTPASLKITDGTVTAMGGISVVGNEVLKAQVQITGGSINFKHLSKEDKQKIKLTSDGRTDLHKVSITLDKEENVQVEDVTVFYSGKEYKYGSEGIFTDGNKKIYLYLPSGGAIVNVAGVEYSGEVEKKSENESEKEKETELLKANAVVTVDSALVLPVLVYGYDEVDIKAVPLVIKNTSVNDAELESVQFGTTFTKDDVKQTVSPFVMTVSGDLKLSGKTEHKGFLVKAKDGLTAGNYKGTLEVKVKGEAEPKKVEVSLTVNKAKVTATAKIDKKVYDGKRAATGTVKIKGGVNGETPEVDEGKVTYTFNNANVKEAKFVTVKNLVLTDEWAKNYELAQTEFQVDAKIKKAPNKHTKDELKKPSVTTVYVKSKGVWQPQLTTYKGQEYLFIKSSHTKLTKKNENSENWIFGDKGTVKNRLVTVTYKDSKGNTKYGLVSGATYTVWTRFAGDDNHEPSEATVAADYTVFTAGQNNGGGTDANGNKINGLTEGTTYKTGSRLAFGAVGAGMSNTSPKEGDERYLPISWKVSEEHTWSSSPYEAAFTINQAGSYTLQVTFRKQTYTNGSWTNTSSTSVSKVNFKMASTGTDGTGYNTSSSTSTTPTSGTGSSTSSTGKTTTSTAAKTGDQSPVLPMTVIFLASAAVLAGYLWKKKSQVKE